MLFNAPIEVLVIVIPALIFSLCIHEFSHGYIAYLYGDKTAYNAGRLTLNPLKHLDPMGSIMILFVGFGWAKPVPISPHLSGKQLRAVAFAGPASNLILALLAGLVIRYFSLIEPYLSGEGNINHAYKAVAFFLIINVSLAVFNMIPIAPLDGSQIFGSLLNPKTAIKLQIYGPQVLLGLILFGIITGYSIIWLVMKPFVSFFVYLFSGINI